MRKMTDIIIDRDVTLYEYKQAKKICQIFENRSSANFDMRILDYPFSVRALNRINYFFDDGIGNKTIDDLKKFIESHDIATILDYGGIGKKTLDELIEAISL